jgi:3-methyladenine DNA glycosylase AlkD
VRRAHPEHAGILDALRSAGDPPSRAPRNDSYGSSGHLYYFVRVPVRRTIARSWLAAHRSASASDVLALIESLFQGESHEEKTLAAILLAYHRGARESAGPKHVERWLDQLSGWAEVDTLCASVFSAEDLLGGWTTWRALIRRLARHASVHKRRAALVLLTGPVRSSPDARLAELAIETIERLQAERDILITKAISWLLRSLATQHRASVARYLAVHEATLPGVAVRETRTKLATGRKSRKAAREASPRP